MMEIQIAAHITRDPAILQGKPIIRGTRVPVYLIIDLFSNGISPTEIVEAYPDLTEEDVEAALAFAIQEHGEMGALGERAYRAGQTKNLRDFAAEAGINLGDELA